MGMTTVLRLIKMGSINTGNAEVGENSVIIKGQGKDLSSEFGLDLSGENATDILTVRAEDINTCSYRELLDDPNMNTSYYWSATADFGNDGKYYFGGGPQNRSR